MENADDSERVNELYSCYERLADCNSEEVSQKEFIFKKIIGAVNGCDKEKRLVSQFIPVFFKYFPGLTEMALDAQLDLCEDPDTSVRRQAIKNLPIFCQDCPRLTKRISVILTQLLLSKDPLELRVVNTALITIFKANPKGTVMGLCHQIRTNKNLRVKCLRFLSFKLCNTTETLKSEAAETMIFEANQLLETAALEEIPLLFKMMFTAYKSLNQGYAGIINSVTEQLIYCLPLIPTDLQTLDRIIILLKHGLFLYVMRYYCGHPNEIVEFVCLKVLPFIEQIPQYEEGKGHALEILQILAELCSYIKSYKNCTPLYNSVMNYTMKCLPNEEQLQTASVLHSEKKIHFTYLESMLFTLHKFTKCNNSVLISNERFKARVTALYQVIKTNYKCLRAFVGSFPNTTLQAMLKSCRGAKRNSFEMTTDLPENHHCKPYGMNSEPRLLIKWKDINAINEPESSTQIYNKNKDETQEMITIAVLTCRNIFKLCKDFLMTPCKCESIINLSFVPEEQCNYDADVPDAEFDKRRGQFHERPISTGLRTQRALYVPPNKRFSTTYRRPQ